METLETLETVETIEFKNNQKFSNDDNKLDGRSISDEQSPISLVSSLDGDEIEQLQNFISATKTKSVHFDDKKLTDFETIQYLCTELKLLPKPENVDVIDLITCHIDAGSDINDINTSRINDIPGEIDKYRIIGRRQSATKLYKGLNEMDDIWLYFILYDNQKIQQILIGSEFIPVFLWYQFEQQQMCVDEMIKESNKIIKIYDPETYINNFEKNERGFIIDIDDGIDIDDLERYFIFNSNFDHLTWGSAWNDFPFRDQVIHNEISIIELAKLAYYSLRQSVTQFSDSFQNANTIINCRTKVSKSIVSFEEYSGMIIVNIKYDPMPVNKNINKLNEKIKCFYPNDLPHDVIVPLLNFRYHNQFSILNVDELTIDNIRISFILCSSDEEHYKIYRDLDKKIKSNSESKLDDHVKNYIGHIRECFEC